MGDTLIGERGPQGNRHLPEYRTGCYLGRATDCCLLCLARLCRAAATPPDSRQAPPRSADGTPQRPAKSAIVSPTDDSNSGGAVAAAGAGFVTVRIDTTTSITIDRTADAQLPAPGSASGADR